MRIINKLIYALNIVILASCSLVPPAETGDVSMSFSEEIHEIFVGESFQFEVVLLPDNRHADAIWHSSNTSVALVSESGVLYAVSPGEATISANYGKSTIQTDILVKALSYTVEGLHISPETVELNVGDEMRLSAEVAPVYLTDVVKPIWRSSNENIVSVNDGNVKAISVGTAEIYAEAGDKQAKCFISVSDGTLGLSCSALELIIGETATLSVTDECDGPVVWESSDPSVASVADGQVVALYPGSASILAYFGNKVGRCLLNVKPISVQSVTIDNSEPAVVIAKGDTLELSVSIMPENATFAVVEWTSSDISVASVENGTVRALEVGETEIKAWSEGKSDTIKIVVVS